MNAQPLQISVSGNTAEEIKAKYIELGKAFGLHLSEGEASPAPTAPAATTEPTKAKKTAAAKKEEKEAPAENVVNIFGDGPAETAKAPTKDEALAVLKRLNEIKGTKVALEVLKKFDALNISQLKPESYAEFMTVANQTADAK